MSKGRRFSNEDDQNDSRDVHQWGNVMMFVESHSCFVSHMISSIIAKMFSSAELIIHASSITTLATLAYHSFGPLLSQAFFHTGSLQPERRRKFSCQRSAVASARRLARLSSHVCTKTRQPSEQSPPLTLPY